MAYFKFEFKLFAAILNPKPVRYLIVIKVQGSSTSNERSFNPD